MNATESYRASRDQLLALRGQHDRAVAEFSWPDVGERFKYELRTGGRTPEKGAAPDGGPGAEPAGGAGQEVGR